MRMKIDMSKKKGNERGQKIKVVLGICTVKKESERKIKK